ncbi:extracellular solute-binding protein [Aliihoeflea sp. PC F10.4]
MKHGISFAALLAFTCAAHADGNLNLYNWGGYTSPELIRKFEQEYDVKVTIAEFNSNETALAKVAAGGSEYDIVFPSGNYVPIYVEQGLLQELDKSRLPNMANIDERWMAPEWDNGRNYSVPWLWGSIGVAVNTSVYDGDINTSSIIFDVPAELKGKINVLPEMSAVIELATMYVGGEVCSEDREVLRKVRDVLLAAKPDWISIDYGIGERLANEDWAASMAWNGATMKARQANPKVKLGFPREGYTMFMDNAALLTGARNVDNAYLFLNFIMEPENAALISGFAGYGNGIRGSDEFLPETMRGAPELEPSAELAAPGLFSPVCSKAANDLKTAIWAEVLK